MQSWRRLSNLARPVRSLVKQQKSLELPTLLPALCFLNTTWLIIAWRSAHHRLPPHKTRFCRFRTFFFLPVCLLNMSRPFGVTHWLSEEHYSLTARRCWIKFTEALFPFWLKFACSLSICFLWELWFPTQVSRPAIEKNSGYEIVRASEPLNLTKCVKHDSKIIHCLWILTPYWILSTPGSPEPDGTYKCGHSSERWSEHTSSWKRLLWGHPTKADGSDPQHDALDTFQVTFFCFG